MCAGFGEDLKRPCFGTLIVPEQGLKRRCFGTLIPVGFGPGNGVKWNTNSCRVWVRQGGGVCVLEG